MLNSVLAAWEAPQDALPLMPRLEIAARTEGLVLAALGPSPKNLRGGTKTEPVMAVVGSNLQEFQRLPWHRACSPGEGG